MFNSKQVCQIICESLFICRVGYTCNLGFQIDVMFITNGIFEYHSNMIGDLSVTCKPLSNIRTFRWHMRDISKVSRMYGKILMKLD